MPRETAPHERLTQLVKRHGSQKAAAASLGITQQYFSDMINLRRDVSVGVLKKLGLRRAIVAVRAAEQGDR